MNPSILLVDDNDADIDFFRLVLEDRGLAETMAASSDGARALEVVVSRQAIGDPFSLIITDHHLPLLEGPELLARLRGDEELGKIPLVMLSGAITGKPAALDCPWYEKPVGYEAMTQLISDLASQYPKAFRRLDAS
jgi:CheY-like chemotaxis protein